MSNKSRGLALVIVGVLVLLVALGADPLGLGGHPGFGWRQISGALIGAVVAGIGLRDLRRG